MLDRLQRVLHGVNSSLDRLVKIDVYVARPEVIATFRAALARRHVGQEWPGDLLRGGCDGPSQGTRRA